ncbi:MAG: hypothetical protein R2818_15430 [Flavobacteriales bacterium]
MTTVTKDDARSKAIVDKLMTKAKGWTSFRPIPASTQNTKDNLM